MFIFLRYTMNTFVQIMFLVLIMTECLNIDSMTFGGFPSASELKGQFEGKRSSIVFHGNMVLISFFR